MRRQLPVHKAFARPAARSAGRPGVKALILAASVTIGLPAAAPMILAQPAPTTTSSNAILTLDDLFALLDKNHDDIVTKDEATGIYARRFLLWDTDGRGWVTRQQIHDFRIAHGIDDDGQRIQPGDSAAPETASILKEPADWHLEHFPVPPPFAPDLKFTGSEEARFSPGMYDTKSDYYFTYALAFTFNGVTAVSAGDLKDFLESYFRGLSTSRASRTGLTVDTAQMQATVTPVFSSDSSNQYSAQVIFIDSFTDGRKVTLNVEAQSIARPATKQAALILLISPSAVDSNAWKNLREVGKKAATNLP
jgi:hypothetical protein